MNEKNYVPIFCSCVFFLCFLLLAIFNPHSKEGKVIAVKQLQMEIPLPQLKLASFDINRFGKMGEEESIIKDFDSLFIPRTGIPDPPTEVNQGERIETPSGVMRLHILPQDKTKEWPIGENFGIIDISKQKK